MSRWRLAVGELQLVLGISRNDPLSARYGGMCRLVSRLYDTLGLFDRIPLLIWFRPF